MATSYEEYEAPYRLDPFKKIHWGTLKGWLEKGARIVHRAGPGGEFRYGFVTRKVLSTTAVKDFTGAELARKLPGETKCLAFAYRDAASLPGLVGELGASVSAGGLWFQRVNQEVRANTPVLTGLRATFLSVKISGIGSDIYGTYYAGLRRHKRLPDRELTLFARRPFSFRPDDVVSQLLSASPEFSVEEIGADKYGGRGKTWTQIFLRPRDADRKDAERALRNHPLCRLAPRLLELLRGLAPLTDLDCVMLTKVAPAGEILRHRDVGDYHGFADGQKLRHHLVLQGEDCVFSMWNVSGERRDLRMLPGQTWYSDVRKPHAVVNRGRVDRLHLCVDVFSRDGIEEDFRDEVR